MFINTKYRYEILKYLFGSISFILGSIAYEQTYFNQIYPNPSSSYFNIEVSSIDDAKVQLIDLRGTVLKETKLTKGIAILSVDIITNGFYFIRVTNQKDFVSVKKVTVIK